MSKQPTKSHSSKSPSYLTSQSSQSPQLPQLHIQLSQEVENINIIEQLELELRPIIMVTGCEIQLLRARILLEIESEKI